MTKQLVGIGSSANDGTGDTLRDGAIKYNANFDELYERLGNNTEILIDIGAGITEGQVLQWGTTPSPAFRAADFNLLTGNLDTNGNEIQSDGTDAIVIKQTGTGDIQLWAGGSGSAYTYIDGDDGYLKWYAPYAELSDLPDATNHHGMLAHVHGTGKAYFAHSAAWVPLVDENQSITVLNDVDTTVNGGPSDGQVLKWVAANNKWQPANDEQGTGGTGGTTQNLFETVNADTGSTTASAANDTLIIAGGTNISTTLSGDTLTIDMTGTLGDLDQNVFTTFGADNGTTTATTTTDTLTFTGGTGITTNLNAGAITITNNAPNVVQNVLQSLSGDTGSYTADASDSSFTIAGGTGITTALSGTTLTITNTVALPSINEGQSLIRGASAYEGVASPTVSYAFTASSSTNYTVNGPGLADANDPTIYVYRGFTYRFDNQTGSGHPLELRVSNGGSQISGTTGSINGVQYWTVPQTLAAGTTYVYQCNIHSSMVGNIVVV
jgi:plastocyanin